MHSIGARIRRAFEVLHIVAIEQTNPEPKRFTMSVEIVTNVIRGGLKVMPVSMNSWHDA